MSDQTTADVLEDAADYIEYHGWTQGNFSDPSGRVCAHRALSMAGRAYGTTFLEGFDAFQRGMSVLQTVVGYGSKGLIYWNDDPDRTEQEVLDAFRKAAKRALGAPS